MTMSDLIRELKLPGEVYILQKRVAQSSEDDWGDLDKEWTDIQEMDGIIQRESEDPETRRGHEEIADYKGFFVSDFAIPIDEVGDYRIYHTFNLDDTPETEFARYFHIKEINRNLVVDKERYHVEMTLELAKKFGDA